MERPWWNGPATSRRCLSYGIAMAAREPLLFKGDDFSQTNVPAVSY